MGSEMTVTFTLANALRDHSVPAVVKAIKAYGIIGWDQYGISGSKPKDRAVIDHALSLVAGYRTYENNWWNINGPDYTNENGWPSDILDGDYDDELHKMGWEIKPFFTDTNPILAKSDTRQYTNQLIMIAALCQQHGAIDTNTSGAAAQIKKLIELLGMEMDEETILKYIKEIPTALDKKQSE